MNVIPQAWKDGFVRLVEPLARALIRLGVTPNAVTTFGALILAGSAAAYGTGNIRLGGALLLLSGLFDIFDGQVARQTGQATAFGAFYDSTLDRVGEALLFGGIAIYFHQGGAPAGREGLGVALAIVTLSASFLVSYTRARAEGLGFENKVGIAARAERIFLLGAPTFLFSAGPNGWLLFWIIVVLAVATVITVVQRVVHVAQITRVPSAGGGGSAMPRKTLPGAAQRKGH